MFCENCGKKLIRGYQFCMECGTPVPPEVEQEQPADSAAQGGAESSAAQGANNAEIRSTPSVEPINNGSGTLVFCQTCGMHMQTSTTVCEKCGMPLGGSRPTVNVSNGNVPLVNNNPIENEFGGISGISDEDIGQINDLLGGGGLEASPQIAYNTPSSGGEMAAIGKSTQSEIDELTRQLESFGASTGDMPAIGVQPVAAEMRQPEPKVGEARELQDFAMDSAEAHSQVFTNPIDRSVPIIEGGSMDEDPSADISLDPYSFVNNVLEGTENAPAAPAVEEIAPAVEEIAPPMQPEDFAPSAPAVEEISPAVEEIAPPMQPEDFAPSAPAVEEIAPAVEEIAPPMQPEDFAPSAPAVEEIAPAVEEVAPPMQPEDFAPSAPAVEEIAPAVEEIAPPMQPEDFAPSAPAVDEIAPAVEEIAQPVQPENFDTEYIEPPVMPEYVPPVMPEYSEPADDETVILDGAPAVAETAESKPSSSAPQRAPSAPASDAPIQLARRPRDPNAPPEEDPVLGKLSYCRNCGQDMYEKETVCKNCGAPYRAPKKHDASLDNRLGGTDGKKKKTVPIIAGSAAVVCAAIVLLIVGVSGKKNKDNLTGNETLSVDTPSTSSAASTSAEPEDSTPDVVTVAPETEDVSAVTEPDEVTPPPTTEDDKPVVAGPETAESTDPAPDTSKPEPATSTPKPAASTSKPTATTTPKPNTTTTPKAAVTTTPKPAATGTVSAKAASLEKDREKIMDAVEKMAAEVGKIDMLAQNVIYTMENASGNAETARTGYYNRDFAKNIISSIDSGKSAVDTAISSAKPKNSELDSVYSQLSTLQKKYAAYYDFIKSPSGSTSKFTSSCSTYLSDFTSTLSSNFKYTKFTSSYTAYETAESYAAAMSDAIAAANNAVSAFSTLEGKLTELKKDNFDTNAVQTLSKSANSKTYANAAAYAQEVAAYRIMLANPPSDYSSAYSYLKTASDKLNALVGLYNMIQENDRSSFSSESSTSITAARSAISSATKEIS